jgi:hypothetical protein
MDPLIRRRRLAQHEAGALEYERRRGRLMAAQAARQRLQQLHDAGLISATTWEDLLPQLEAEIGQRLAAQRALLQEQPGLEAAVRNDAREEWLRAQRAALMTLLNEGVLSEEVYEELVREVDVQLEQAVAAAAAKPTPPPTA